MSETTIFIFGSIIFAITVAGSVMAGGFTFWRIAADEDDQAPRSTT